MPADERGLSNGWCQLPARLASWLDSRKHVVPCLVLLGLALTSPSLVTGLVADDFLHQLSLREAPGIPGLSPKTLDLFRFANGDPETARLLMNHGVFPWWADGHLVLAFFRPLAGVTHWLDHRLWPTAPALMHLQSLLWFGLLLGLAAHAYLRFSPSRRAGLLALLLLAVDDLHAPAVGWIANRSLTIALVFSMLALLAHDRARRAKSTSAAWLAPALLAAGLGAGEAALTGAAYLLAYALFFDQASRRSRFFSLASYAAVILAWRIIYGHLGYGAAGSGIYIDPGAEPLAFARLALTRVPVLLLSVFAVPWADLWDVYPLFMPSLRPVVLGLALGVGVGLAALLRPLLRESRSARFWAAGCVLSVVPCAATFPHDRLLLGTAIGAMALLSELLLHHARAVGRTSQLAVSVLAVVHLVLGPLLLPYRSASVAHLSKVLWQADASLPRGPELAQQILVIANPPLVPFGAYLPIYREAAREPRPLNLLWLATGVSDVRIRRVDFRTLSVRPALGYLTDASQLMLRSLSRPLPRGAKVVLDEATFEVVELTADGRPAEVVVRFERDLRDARFVFLRWAVHGYVRFELPPVGASVVLPRVDLRAALSG
jgi:hypothetical protein